MTQETTKELKQMGEVSNLKLKEKRGLKVRNAGEGTHQVGDVYGSTPRNWEQLSIVVVVVVVGFALSGGDRLCHVVLHSGPMPCSIVLYTFLYTILNPDHVVTALSLCKSATEIFLFPATSNLQNWNSRGFCLAAIRKKVCGNWTAFFFFLGSFSFCPSYVKTLCQKFLIILQSMVE